MINIIKTAIITIIISFASGLLLNYFTNLAPRILCNVKNGIPLELNSKKIWAYIITVVNTSSKTIHELALNIQSSQTNLKSTDATITQGLKFDSSIKDNILDVYIPFLSKGDKFSVTVYVENQYAVHNKPIISIRSPENFKEINSVDRKGILSLLFDIPKNINQVILKIMKNPSKNKKTMIIIVSIVLVIIAGGLGKFYFNGQSANSSTPVVKTVVPSQSTGVAGSSGDSTKGNGTKTSTGKTTKSTGTTGTVKGTTDTNTSTGTSSGTPSTKASTGTSSGTTNTKASTGTSSGTPSTNTSTGTSSGTTNTKASTGTSSGTPSTNTSTGTSSGTTGTAGTTTGTTGN